MAAEQRVVIDTSVVVSALLLPDSLPRHAMDFAMSRCRLLISEATVAELDDVLRRPQFSRYFSDEQRLEFLAAFVGEARVTEISEQISACRDANDDKFIELAVAGEAIISSPATRTF